MQQIFGKFLRFGLSAVCHLPNHQFLLNVTVGGPYFIFATFSKLEAPEAQADANEVVSDEESIYRNR